MNMQPACVHNQHGLNGSAIRLQSLAEIRDDVSQRGIVIPSARFLNQLYVTRQCFPHTLLRTTRKRSSITQHHLWHQRLQRDIVTNKRYQCDGLPALAQAYSLPRLAWRKYSAFAICWAHGNGCLVHIDSEHLASGLKVVLQIIIPTPRRSRLAAKVQTRATEN